MWAQWAYFSTLLPYCCSRKQFDTLMEYDEACAIYYAESTLSPFISLSPNLPFMITFSFNLPPCSNFTTGPILDFIGRAKASDLSLWASTGESLPVRQELSDKYAGQDSFLLCAQHLRLYVVLHSVVTTKFKPSDFFVTRRMNFHNSHRCVQGFPYVPLSHICCMFGREDTF
ncbi:MAG: hypothetical protein NXY57DRAFT_1026090 [Lentinula lateritia]|nr:MAG: hypothetical protein NXY57DRAFT_1026090 [Lentinula lateritia]